MCVGIVIFGPLFCAQMCSMKKADWSDAHWTWVRSSFPGYTCPHNSDSAILQGIQKQTGARLPIIPLWCHYMADLTPEGLLCLHNDLAELPKRDWMPLITWPLPLSLRKP